jgi:hypothetical protein
VGAAAHWRLSHGGLCCPRAISIALVCVCDKKERARVREKESACERARASKCACVGRRATLMQYPHIRCVCGKEREGESPIKCVCGKERPLCNSIRVALLPTHAHLSPPTHIYAHTPNLIKGVQTRAGSLPDGRGGGGS